MSNTEYYVAVGTQKTGPFSMPDLMNQDIAKDTLIWKKGLINWTAATNLPELEDLLDNTPPPIPDQPPPIPTITRAKAEPVTLTMNVPKISPEVKQGLKTAGSFMLSLTQKVFLTILVIIVCGLVSMPLPAIGRSVITFFVAIPAIGAIWTGFFSRKGKEEVEMPKGNIDLVIESQEVQQNTINRIKVEVNQPKENVDVVVNEIKEVPEDNINKTDEESVVAHNEEEQAMIIGWFAIFIIFATLICLIPWIIKVRL
jgi:GYF domain 2